MSINNSSIIKHIAQKNSISPTTVKKILQSYEDYIESHLINNNTIKVLDVGSLRIEKKNKRVVSQS
jgi:nucleoid DNA-binding protein